MATKLERLKRHRKKYNGKKQDVINLFMKIKEKIRDYSVIYI